MHQPPSQPPAVYLNPKKMNELHDDYISNGHLEEQQEEEENAPSPKEFGREELTVDEELQSHIMEEVRRLQRKDAGADSISEDLENKLDALLARIGRQSDEEIVQIRMNELALSKILVYTHGKSEFRLVLAHHHIGKAYLNYRCYEQAIDHLTIALKKNSRLTSIRSTKLYHTYILRALSRCYYEIASFEDALEVLAKAEQIQKTYHEDGQSDQSRPDLQTLRLVANCHTKLKNYKKAHEYFERAQAHAKGEGPQLPKLQIDEAKTYFQQKSYSQAISLLNTAIQSLISVNYPNRLQLVELQELLSQYYEKSGEVDKQIDTLMNKLQLYTEVFDEAHKNTLKMKRSIVTVLMKQKKHDTAIKMLEDIRECEEKIYGPSSMHVGKTLKMMGLNYFQIQKEISSAEHYLKLSLKIFQEQGSAKLAKEIKAKLSSIKEMKERRINNLISQD